MLLNNHKINKLSKTLKNIINRELKKSIDACISIKLVVIKKQQI